MKDKVQSVERAIQILEAFNGDKETLTFTEIMHAVDLPKSTTFRMLQTLIEHGFIAEEAKQYRLGIKLFILGNLVSKNNNLHKVVRPIMEQLGEQSGEFITLNILVDNQRLCIGKVDSKREIQHSVSLGSLLPVYAGSGKVLLASLPDDQIIKILNTTHIEKLTPSTITDIDQIMIEIRNIRAQGYYYSKNERLEGVWSIAAPIRDHRGEVVANISMAGLNMYNNEELLETNKQLLLKAVKQASLLLGCNPRLLV
ncbi:IclR family transcriptional regulator [Anaerospora hongkongensis]|uniref:Glycerol operon regulatory protein n=1 Tax=Anaerospora hongkongensis TaxID=244830 RepID=A0A4R1QA86_9FIRM|nr:IclR family transcriptional regulator [Anaerospora hongkongensis]TCL38857.1 IclR family transcriptional regulator [Anaerospora hongkongensis]